MARLASAAKDSYSSSSGSSYSTTSSSSSGSSPTSPSHLRFHTVSRSLTEAIQAVIDGNLGARDFFNQAPAQLQEIFDASSLAVCGVRFTELEMAKQKELLRGILKWIRQEQKKTQEQKSAARQKHRKLISTLIATTLMAALGILLIWWFRA